ncbi:MAG: DUF2490 domain-containing protein [Chitinophagaceae bacterium]
MQDQRAQFRVLLISLFFAGPLQAQTKETETLNQVWFGYFNQTRINTKWGTWADVHLRTKDDFFKGLSVGIARVGITYFLNNQTRLLSGYAYVHNYPVAPHSSVSRPEHRPWQMILWNTKFPTLQLQQNLRLEERFRRKILNEKTLAPGYNFNFRVRYAFQLLIPLSDKPGTPGSSSFVFSDEVHINLGKEIIYNYFDQNRLFAGMSFQLTNTDQLQMGYTNIFLQLPAGNRFRNIHGIRLYYLQNLDLRKNLSAQQ